MGNKVAKRSYSGATRRGMRKRPFGPDIFERRRQSAMDKAKQIDSAEKEVVEYTIKERVAYDVVKMHWVNHADGSVSGGSELIGRTDTKDGAQRLVKLARGADE